MHLTDDQAGVVGKRTAHASAGGMACDDSYAFHCARCLLTEESIDFLNNTYAPSTQIKMWEAYNSWLSQGGDFLPVG